MKKFYEVVQDEAGNIVVGAEVYLRNNSSPFALVTLYSDDGVTPTANPMVSQSDGYVTGWTADNTLRVEVYIDGELTKTINDWQHYDDLDNEIKAIRTCGTSAANLAPYFTGLGTGSTYSLTAFGRTLAGSADAPAALVTLGMDTDTTLAANSDTVFPSQKAIKTYVDQNSGGGSGFSWKDPVRVATTVAGTLASSFENGDTVDGVVLATGNRILIKNQAAPAENGIYTVNASGAPTRSTDADAGSELVSAALFVSAGTVNHDTQWTCTNDTPPTLGVTAITFVQIASGSGLLQAINNLSDVSNVATARTNLGIGTAGVLDVATAAQWRANTADKILDTDGVWASADYVALTDAATVAVDFSAGFNFSLTIGGNRTLGAPSNTKNGQVGAIVITQDGTGSRTLAYHANWKFAGGTDPTLSTAAGSVDVLFYQVISSTSIIANLVKAIA